LRAGIFICSFISAMFFIISKMLAFLLSPLLWALVLIAAGLLTNKPGAGKKLMLSGALVLFLCGNSFLVDECFRHWETVTPDIDSSNVKYDGAIVLGGLGDIDLRQKKIMFGRSADRLFQTIPLYYSGRIRRIIFTGGSGSVEFPEKKEGIFVRSYLLSIGFPDSALIVEDHSRNTWENAVNTKHILDSMNLKGRMLLVTSAFHMPRAMAVFKKAGFKNLQPFVTNKISGVRRFTPDHLLIPNAGAIAGLELLLHEMFGFAVYKIKGYA
jgi:uncharacterized SAM-binding protein YcdF (DUF218 family)